MTGIEWTERTWNPTVGCDLVSPGCTNCYAMKVAHRLANNPNLKVAGKYRGLTRVVNGRPVWTGAVRPWPPHLELPLKRRTPTVWFVDSESDLFHPGLADADIDRVFAVMALAPQHTFQILTKRPERMQAYMTDTSTARADGRGEAVARLAPETLLENLRWPLPNVWLGVSVEDQRRADERVPLLLNTPAAVRFLSCEPLLGPVDLTRWLRIAWRCSGCGGYFSGSYRRICPDCGRAASWSGSHRFNGRGLPEHPVVPHQVGMGLDWVIAGGESGRRARPSHPTWFRALRDQCQAAGVPYFFKQWGEWLPYSHFADAGIVDDPEATRFDTMEWCGRRWDDVGRPIWSDFTDGHVDDEQCVGRVGKKTAGRLLDGREHNAMPPLRAEVPA